MTLNTEILERSFGLIQPQAESFTATFYATLFTRYSEVEPLFAHTAMSEQGKKFIDAGCR
jgi:hemoglobin-like flavoprotein